MGLLEKNITKDDQHQPEELQHSHTCGWYCQNSSPPHWTQKVWQDKVMLHIQLPEPKAGSIFPQTSPLPQLPWLVAEEKRSNFTPETVWLKPGGKNLMETTLGKTWSTFLSQFVEEMKKQDWLESQNKFRISLAWVGRSQQGEWGSEATGMGNNKAGGGRQLCLQPGGSINWHPENPGSMKSFNDRICFHPAFWHTHLPIKITNYDNNQKIIKL